MEARRLGCGGIWIDKEFVDASIGEKTKMDSERGGHAEVTFRLRTWLFSRYVEIEEREADVYSKN